MHYISTRNEHNNFTNNFSKIIMEGLASDGGLYIPKTFSKFSTSEIDNMVNMDYTELCTEIISKYSGSCLTKGDIKKIAIDSYKNFGINYTIFRL